MKEVMKLKNKEFVFHCLEHLKKSGNFSEDKLAKLTNKNFCKDKFDMNYPVLQEVNYAGSINKEMFLDHAGNRRYYPDTIIINEKRYIVCNDWYYGSTRDTRSEFARWCLVDF